MEKILGARKVQLVGFGIAAHLETSTTLLPRLHILVKSLP